jgi:hypothetical protein
MNEAFRENGPLCDSAEEKAEQQALQSIFRGSIGYFKNPLSHRARKLEFEQAYQLLMLASFLLRIVDERSSMNGQLSVPGEDS